MKEVLNLLKYTLRWLKDLIPTIFLVATLIFIVTRIVPGDPASAMLGPQASPDEVVKLREELGLNAPKITQYLSYMKGLLKFDLGTSLRYNESVFSMIMSRFPNTVILSISSLFLALLFGIPIGIISASKKGSFIDFSH